MATIDNSALILDENDYSVIQYKWETLTTTNDNGRALELPVYPEKTVHILGTFGSGGTVKIQGSNDGTNWIDLTDTRGNTISKIATYLGTIAENPRYIRPFVSAGDGTTDIDVILIARRNIRGR